MCGREKTVDLLVVRIRSIKLQEDNVELFHRGAAPRLYQCGRVIIQSLAVRLAENPSGLLWQEQDDECTKRALRR